jgi:splicing factor 3B subunit 4
LGFVFRDFFCCVCEFGNGEDGKAMTTRITPGVGANLLGQHAAERNQDATAYVGNLDSQVSEELLWELFVQAGPVVNVYVPKDRVTNLHQGYGFVEFRSEEDADYVSP